MSRHASALMHRHGYAVDPSGRGPHTNVLGHPLLELVLWVDSATAERLVERQALLDVCSSSLFGYLSVRADDDFFDEAWDEAEIAMMTSAVFRARHQALLARHISDIRFWDRFESIWQNYAEAMLQEQRFHEPQSDYAPDQFDMVLGRSQPLEIPASAVLVLKDRWELVAQVADLVSHLTRATQIFDDFVDAPSDLASGNYTLMVRRLGGLDSSETMRRAMLTSCDEVMAEVSRELDLAADLAKDLGIHDLEPWADERRRLMSRASEVMFSALFDHLSGT